MKHITAIGHIVVRVYEGGQKWQVFVLDYKENGYKVIHTTEVVSTL